MKRVTSCAILVGSLALALHAAPVRAEMSAEELAKLAQNPVGNLISLPFQNNTNFNFGPRIGISNHPFPHARLYRRRGRASNHTGVW